MKKILWAACLMAALSLAGCSDDENGNGGNGGNGGSGEGGNPSGGDLTEILFEDGTQIGDGRQEFEIKGDYTLPKGTYLLKGWCYIADGASLTLAPGTIIKGDKGDQGSAHRRAGRPVVGQRHAERADRLHLRRCLPAAVGRAIGAVSFSAVAV